MALKPYYTTHIGPGASITQLTPSESLGGYTSTTPWGGGVLNDLFNKASDLNVQDGRPDFRAIYLYNDAPDITLVDVRVYAVPGTTGAAGITMGADPRPASYIDSLSPQLVEAATVYSPPAGVVFAGPSDYDHGVVLDNLPPLAGKGVWVRRIPMGASGAPADYTDLIFQDRNGATLIRRIYWETGPYSDTTRPGNPPDAVPTPSPFKKVTVDFLTEGGSRITWDLDASIIDDGPYVYQLQFSHSGIASESDWSDVGPPAEDTWYLLDPNQRLWGAGLTTAHYRVLLTTASGSYASQPAPLFGTLTNRDWTMVREVLRKERLMLREFVGQNGFLLRARRYGTLCSCVDPNTGEIGNSNCPICYGNKYVGGFYTPIPLWFANTTNPKATEKVEYNEGMGTVKSTTVFGRVTADNIVASRDVWVSYGEDERFYIHEVKEISSFRSTPVVYQLEFRRAPENDILNRIKLVRPEIAYPDWQTEEIITV